MTNSCQKINEKAKKMNDETSSLSSLSESEMEYTPTEDAVLPPSSLISHNNRTQLESDILFVATCTPVQNALLTLAIEIVKAQSTATHGTILKAFMKGGKTGLKQEFEHGVQIMLEASCDRRLETSHWMVGMLWEDREDVAGRDLVEWFFHEARMLAEEVDEGHAKELGTVFGFR